jgi:phosphoenolpyruvate---glycerone phosphotransferase subunit DhaM
MPAIEVEVLRPEGLHARPAVLVVRAASELDARVLVSRVDEAGMAPADARSIIAILALGIRAGDRVRVEAEGPDADRALAALAALLVDASGPIASAELGPGPSAEQRP